MARPRVFVSSTYYDLKHVRASMEVFIQSLGFDAILFEKGDIAFSPDSALDVSCYREAETADIFVLIIGGRYGSAISSAAVDSESEFFDRYDSITKKEFDTAQDAGVPCFILVDGSVQAEYRTFTKNRDNTGINYAHVDSVGVFHLIEAIYEKNRNNPVFSFDRATDIEAWLREQWAGLFRDLLHSRSEQKQLSALSAQVSELKSINSTLRTYMEEVLSTVNPTSSVEIIKGEEKKMEEARLLVELSENKFFKHLMIVAKLDEQAAIDLIAKPGTVDEIVDRVDKAMSDTMGEGGDSSVLHRLKGAQRDFNTARSLLGSTVLDFSKSKYSDVARVAKTVDARDIKIKKAPLRS